MRLLRLRERQALFRGSALTLCAAHLLWVFVSACGPVVAPHSRQRASGEALYRGIFFGEGDIVASVPELRGTFEWQTMLDSTQRKAVHEFVDQLIPAIRQTDPAFLDAFGDALQSGDHLRIDRMVERANEVTVTALDRIPAVANWRAELANNQAAVQAELIRLHNAGTLSQADVEAASAQLSLMVAAKDDLRAAQAGAMELSRGWALAVVVGLAIVVGYPPLVLAVALVVFIAYAWAWGGGGPGGSHPPKKMGAGAGSVGAGTLHRDQIIDALATRLAMTPALVQ
jgi:SdpC family antimicrobial peptide